MNLYFLEQVFSNAIESLSDDDKQLPQILTLLPLLKRGVGIHHGGLLPILKEVIEILFQEGLIKCLFATETFSIGINMPAKTVVFTNTRKYDGKDFRWITSGEYIQMSGRAGRRGKDDSGIVIQMVDEKIEPDVCKGRAYILVTRNLFRSLFYTIRDYNHSVGMIYGASDPLFSSYHVSYNMVLNMLRVEDANPEHVLRSSFLQYQQEKQAPELELQADELIREASSITVHNETQVADYYLLRKIVNKLQAEVLTHMHKPVYCLPFLQPGRMLRIVFGGVDWGWGVFTQMKKASAVNPRPEPAIGLAPGTIADSLLEILLVVSDVLEEEERIGELPYRPSSHPDTMASVDAGEMQLVKCTIEAIGAFGVVRLNLPKDLHRPAARGGVHKSIIDIQRRFASEGGVPTLDPSQDMGISDASFLEIYKELQNQKKKLEGLSSQVICTEEGKEGLKAYECRLELLQKAELLRTKARQSQTVAMKEELRKMKRALKRLGYTTEKGVLELKGRFCCEITTADEIVLTDMVFDGVFNELSAEQAVGLLSCFVHKEPSKETNPKIRQDLEVPFRKLKEAARVVAKISIEAKIEMDEEEYVNSFNPSMMEVAFAWAKGAKFIDICRLTDIFEGSIIRTLKRLEELLRQLSSAAGAIGNAELKTKFEDGADKIRRGVVFAASLYL